MLDRAKLRAEAKLDGEYLLSISDPDLSADSSGASAPTCCCWLALLLVRVAERQTGTTWRQLAGFYRRHRIGNGDAFVVVVQ